MGKPARRFIPGIRRSYRSNAFADASLVTDRTRGLSLLTTEVRKHAEESDWPDAMWSGGGSGKNDG